MLVALGCAGPAAAADRTVLGEFITSDLCLSCEEAAPIVSDLVARYPDFAFIGLAFGDDNETQWAFDRATAFYGPMGFSTPFFVFDGLTAPPIDPPDFALYEAEYLSRLPVTTDVTIDLRVGSSAGRDSAFDFTADVCVEVGGQGKTMRIYMVEVLDNFPETAHFVRWGFRQATATEDVTLSAGECADVVKTLSLDATSMDRMEDVRIIAWAQAPLANGPAEVYQAAVLSGPFDGIFSDGFESGDTSGWSASVR